MVLPTPPFPMTMTRPCSVAASSSTSARKSMSPGGRAAVGRRLGRQNLWRGGKKTPQRLQAHDVLPAQRDFRVGRALNSGGMFASACAPRRSNAAASGSAGIGRPKHTVDDELLIGQPLGAQLGAGARGFDERHAVGPRDEHDRRRRRIGKRPHRGFISLALRLQAGERSQTRNIARRRLPESRSTRREARAGATYGRSARYRRSHDRRRASCRDRSAAARTHRKRQLQPCRRPRDVPAEARTSCSGNTPR